jgi:hypothetical protein
VLKKWKPNANNVLLQKAGSFRIPVQLPEKIRETIVPALRHEFSKEESHLYKAPCNDLFLACHSA